MLTPIEKARILLSRSPGMSELCEHIIERFFVNDYFAQQNDEGAYCPARYKGQLVPITPEIVLLALRGFISIGSYTTSHEDKCKFMSFDFDCDSDVIEERGKEAAIEELKPVVRRVMDVLKGFGLHPILEFSGNKGFHIFCFFKQPLPVWDVFYAMLYVKNRCRTKCETYPKQESIVGLEFGNQIKIPLCVNRKSGHRSRLLNHDFTPMNQQYRCLIDAPYSPTHKIADMARYGYEQEQRKMEYVAIIKERREGEEGVPSDLKVKKGERNLKIFIFIAKCIELGMNYQDILSAGYEWITNNKDVFDNNVKHAMTLFEQRLKYALRNPDKESKNKYEISSVYKAKR